MLPNFESVGQWYSMHSQSCATTNYNIVFVIVHDPVLEINLQLAKSTKVSLFYLLKMCIRGPLSSYCAVLPEHTAYLKEPFFLKLFEE